MKRITSCDTELLKLLQQIDISQIDYLVDILTDEGKGRIGLSSAIKDLLLWEKNNKKYTEDGLRNLLHELQNYGGHSAINIFRREPLSYAEILTDVHIKLNGIDSKNKSISQKEREIVLSLFGDNWHTLPDHTRWERCIEPKVLSGFFKMRENFNLNEKKTTAGLSSIATSAIFFTKNSKLLKATIFSGQLALIINESIGEAYRITIPFIAHIAMLKMSKTSTQPENGTQRKST